MKMKEIRQNDMHDFVRNSLNFAKPFWRLDTWTIKGVMANKGNRISKTVNCRKLFFFEELKS